MPAASDVQLYDGMLSGSVLAFAPPSTQTPTDLLIDGTVAPWDTSILSVSDVLLTVGAIQSATQVVLCRLGLWYLRPNTSMIQIASFRFGAFTTAHDPPIPPIFHRQRGVPAPEPGCSLVLGFQVYAVQPGGADTTLSNGVGAVRCYYGATTTAGVLATGGAG